MDGYLPISVMSIRLSGSWWPGKAQRSQEPPPPHHGWLQLDGGVPWREIDMIKKHTLTPQRKRSGLWSGADLNVATEPSELSCRLQSLHDKATFHLPVPFP